MPRPPEAGESVEVKIRYQHRPAAARVFPRPDGAAEVRFDQPQPAVTPGQLCAFYRGDQCLGGAPIERPLDGQGAPPKGR